MEDNSNTMPRAYVLEMSVKIEHLLNIIITRVLGVNPEDTRSFGITSQALSFHAKSNLLLDLKYLNKEQVVKFQIFMEIRNKFGHLHSVDSYIKCFAITKNFEKLKKLLKITENGKTEEEKEMEHAFIMLSLDIAKTLHGLSEKINSEMATKYTQRRFTDEIKNSKENFKKENPQKAEAVDDFIDYIKSILLDEVDLKIKNNVSPHI